MREERPSSWQPEDKHKTRRSWQRGGFLASWMDRQAAEEAAKDDQEEDDDDEETSDDNKPKRVRRLWSSLFPKIGVTEKVEEKPKPTSLFDRLLEKPKDIAEEQTEDSLDSEEDVLSEEPEAVEAGATTLEKEAEKPPQEWESEPGTQYQGELVVDHSDEKTDEDAEETETVSTPLAYEDMRPHRRSVKEESPLREVKPTSKPVEEIKTSEPAKEQLPEDAEETAPSGTTEKPTALDRSVETSEPEAAPEEVVDRDLDAELDRAMDRAFAEAAAKEAEELEPGPAPLETSEATPPPPETPPPLETFGFEERPRGMSAAERFYREQFIEPVPEPASSNGSRAERETIPEHHHRGTTLTAVLLGGEFLARRRADRKIRRQVSRLEKQVKQGEAAHTRLEQLAQGTKAETATVNAQIRSFENKLVPLAAVPVERLKTVAAKAKELVRLTPRPQAIRSEAKPKTTPETARVPLMRSPEAPLILPVEQAKQLVRTPEVSQLLAREYLKPTAPEVRSTSQETHIPSALFDKTSETPRPHTMAEGLVELAVSPFIVAERMRNEYRLNREKRAQPSQAEAEQSKGLRLHPEDLGLETFDTSPEQSTFNEREYERRHEVKDDPRTPITAGGAASVGSILAASPTLSSLSAATQAGQATSGGRSRLQELRDVPQYRGAVSSGFWTGVIIMCGLAIWYLISR